MRVLCYLPSTPWPADRGTRQRSALLLRALGDIADVEIGLRESPKEPAQSYLAEYTVHTYQGSAGKVDRLNRLVDSLGNVLLGARRYRRDPLLSGWLLDLMTHGSFDAIVGRYGVYSAEAGIPDLPRSVIDIDDLMSTFFRNRANVPSVSLTTRLAANGRSNLFRNIERRRLADASHLWLSSQADFEALGLPNSSILPNIPFHPGSPLPLATAKPQSLLFVGRLSWSPNSKGVSWFLRNVWPILLSTYPNLRFRIVGAGLSETLVDEWNAVPGVKVAGFVDDLKAEYRRADIVVAPIFEGAGTKIKILEALAFGRPCVTTPAGYDGLAEHIRAGTSIRVATPSAFASVCLELLADRVQRAALGASGFQAVIRYYSYERFRNEVSYTLQRVINASAN